MSLAAALVLRPGDESKLNAVLRSSTVEAGLAQRARIVLLAAAGVPNAAIARQVGVSGPTVLLWRNRYEAGGLEALGDLARSGRPPVIDDVAVVVATLEAPPAKLGITHWSARLLGDQLGISFATVARIWRKWNLQPWRVETFKFSTDPELDAKIRDVVGLYLNPPTNAVAVCVDEKSQVQALDRSAPILPLRPGIPAKQTHDYVRHGTTTLFAALEVLEGRVIGQCFERHRHQEFLRFLRRLDQEFPGPVPLHLVMDNYGTHQHPKVRDWLQRHPRFVSHFVPTSSSWLNLIERWFAELTTKRVRRDSFHSVHDLEKAITEFLAVWNEHPQPFVWTATVESIKEKLSRCRQTLEQIQPGCTLPRSRKRRKTLSS